MKSQIFILLSLAASSYAYSQTGRVGINTENPQNTFHIDGGKDNPLTGAPSDAQQANDIIITNDGKIGVGMTAPKNLLNISKKGNTTGVITSFVDGITLTADTNSPGWSGPGFYLEGANATAGQKLFKLNYTRNTAGNSFLNFQAVSDDASSNTRQIMSVYHNGNVGIGGNPNTTPAAERLDVVEGNVRVRTINTNVGNGTTDRRVVADANGILKTIDNEDYNFFHSRLINNQTLSSDALTNTVLFGSPIATSPFYTYNTSTGILTFNSSGLYFITYQGGFSEFAAGTHLLLGIINVATGQYIGRGSNWSALARTGNVGQMSSYTTMINVPSSGYQVRFIAYAGNSGSAVLLANETGGSGTGNVTNLTIQKTR